MAAQPQTFEVASVKPSGAASVRDSGGGPGTSDPTHFHFTSATMQDLIARAWNLAHYYQISAREALDKQRLDVSVLVPAGADREQFRMMLRKLLAERFHLKVHVESKEFPGYELVVAKSGPKVKESIPDAPLPKPAGEKWPDLIPGRYGFARHLEGGRVWLRAQQASMEQLAAGLRLEGNPPIVDKTGLTGVYDLALEYATPLGSARDAAATDPLAVPEMFEALKQQLGLQLISKKVPLDFVVVESFDKLPSEN
jgi:uncharacterized protein (TIGR03435 family)